MGVSRWLREIRWDSFLRMLRARTVTTCVNIDNERCHVEEI